MNVVEYCTEEVRRQGHNVTILDGIERVSWMLEAWCYALHRQPELEFIDIANIGGLIERKKNRRGFRTVPVRVGVRLCPPAETIHREIKMLFEQRNAMTPIEFYKEFELIHPFVDGNGRTGKVLLNWLSGTLLNPIFPPADLFGEPILNP